MIWAAAAVAGLMVAGVAVVRGVAKCFEDDVLDWEDDDDDEYD